MCQCPKMVPSVDLPLAQSILALTLPFLFWRTGARICYIPTSQALSLSKTRRTFVEVSTAFYILAGVETGGAIEPWTEFLHLAGGHGALHARQGEWADATEKWRDGCDYCFENGWGYR